MYDDISVKIQLRPGRAPIRIYWSATDLFIIVVVLSVFYLIWKYWNSRIREIDSIERFTAEQDRVKLRVVTIDEDLGEINDFLEGDSFMSYLQTVPKSQYTSKLSAACEDMNGFKRGLRSLIMSSAQISEDDYKYLLKAVSIANQTLTDFTTRFDLVNFQDVFQRTPWNIIIVNDESDRYEKGMPCTLDRYIMLPYRFIRQSGKVDMDGPLTPNPEVGEEQQRLPLTLIHEKIHIIQRHHQADFNSYYRRIWGRFLSRREFPWKYREMYFVNPDGLDINWTYGTFFPFLESTETGVREWYMDISAPRESAWKTRAELLETVLTIPDADKIHSGMSIYHPNEFFAYSVIENIQTAASRLLFVRDLDSLFGDIRNKAT